MDGGDELDSAALLIHAGVPHVGVSHAGVIHAGVDETGNALLIHSPVITSKLVHRTTVFTCSCTNGGISYAWRTR